jgi:hypothetical protein
MEVRNVGLRHLAGVVWSFMFAATTANVVETFRRWGIGVDKDGDLLRCRMSAEDCRWLVLPVEAGVATSGEADEELELEPYQDECIWLLSESEDLFE